MDNSLKGKLALVTEASAGIGAACARMLAAQGCHLALHCSLSTESWEDLDGLGNELQDEFGDDRVYIVDGDLGSVEQISELFREVEEQFERGIDILISNQEFARRAFTGIEDIDLAQFEQTINLNLRGPFLLAKGVIPHMKKQCWGRIIFISSSVYDAGLHGCPTDYAASSGGLTSMMKNLSTRLARYSITVNEVAPAVIEEPGLISHAANYPIVHGIPMHRLGTPMEVANVVQMFCNTGYVTGQSVMLA